jgi:hypothetical protein
MSGTWEYMEKYYEYARFIHKQFNENTPGPYKMSRHPIGTQMEIKLGPFTMSQWTLADMERYLGPIMLSQ